MPREKFNMNRLVYTLYTTKENEYINIKIEYIIQWCKEKVIRRRWIY